MTEAHPVIYDLAVIGGGINGTGIARDATLRGARVILFEAGDLAGGTSSASTKLVHGGLRYLEHYEFALVREALSERERLWKIAPHIIHPLRFVLPYRQGLRPAWLLRLGLFLYDHIGGRKALPPTRSIRFADHVAGPPLKPDFVKGFEYSDGWVDDARLVVLNARDAADRGATIRTNCPVKSLRRVDGLWQIDLGDGVPVLARAVANAAGPRVMEAAGLAAVASKHGIRLVRGSHIVVKRLFDHDFAYFFQLPDGRIFFAIPYERDFTLIGTTDRDHDDADEAPRASDEEIAYLCEGTNQYFRTQITPADVVWTYSGLRPLIDDGSGKPEAATRGYSFEIDTQDGGVAMLSVFGGKITTYRELAKEACDKLAAFLPVLAAPCATDQNHLPGGDFAMTGLAALMVELSTAFPFLDAATIDRIARAYGRDAWQWLEGAQGFNDLGTHFGAGLTAREVEWMVSREWARTADDILWRRSKLGLRMDAAGRAALEAWLARQDAA